MLLLRRTKHSDLARNMSTRLCMRACSESHCNNADCTLEGFLPQALAARLFECPTIVCMHDWPWQRFHVWMIEMRAALLCLPEPYISVLRVGVLTTTCQ